MRKRGPLADILVDTRAEIERRLSELRPLVAEYERLQAARDALAAIPSARTSTPRRTPKRGPGRPKGSATARPASAKAGRKAGGGRRKGTGARAAQALEVVTGQPGITTPEIAQKMRIKQNYLYRVLPALQKEGRVRKDGKGWHPAG